MRFRSLFWDVNPTHRSSVFLAGVGRSGTTWVANLLNDRNQYRVLFEPFHPHRVPEATHFEYLQYLRPDSLRPDLYESASKILTGRCRNGWCDKENSKRIATRRLIKEVRCNLMLKWLRKNFPGMPIMLLLRHPCAVASSWHKLNWGIEDGGVRDDLQILLSQSELVSDYLGPFLSLAKDISSGFERHVLVWCILNYVPLRQFSRDEVHLVFYEELCRNPEEEVTRMYSFLGRNSAPLNRRLFERPSSQSRQDSAILTGGNLIDSWRESVPREWSVRAMEILSSFGLDKIYSTDSRPNVEEAYRWLEEQG